MSSARRVTAYPFGSLEPVERAATRRLGQLRPFLELGVRPHKLAKALGEVLEMDAQLSVRGVTSAPPRGRSYPIEIALELTSGQVSACVRCEVGLATAVLCRMLRREVRVGPESPFDATLRGALSAIAVEVLRRTRAELPVRALEQTPLLERASVYVDATLLLDGCPYGLTAQLFAGFAPKPVPKLAELGNVPVSVPCVVAVATLSRREFSRLSVGSAFMPGALWITADLSGRGVLSAPTADHGAAVDLCSDGKIVVRGESVSLALDPENDMTDSQAPNHDTLQEAVLESPIVVRVELGAVRMTAREFAALRPGDVIETGQRVGELAVLRVAGRDVARGELVSIEGELGIRIRELLTRS